MLGGNLYVPDDYCRNVGKAGMDMGNDYKSESRKQYLKYFRVWFIIVGVLLVISTVVLVKNVMENKRTRTNLEAPTERVYDYADILTEEQEDSLRDYIAKAESKYKIDIVLLTTNQPMEGTAAMELLQRAERPSPLQQLWH